MLDELWDYSREGDPITFTGYRVYDDAAHRFVDAPEDDQRLIRGSGPDTIECDECRSGESDIR